MNQLAGKRITVTGGGGFLGKHVVRRLSEIGCQNIFIARSKDYDLVDNDAVKRLYRDSNPDIVIHLAATVGGIGANMRSPGTFLYNNTMIGLQTTEQARIHGVEKFVGIGTTCSYPKFATIPFKEDDLWNGYPEETNAPYGLAKRMLLSQAQAYRRQYGFNAIHLLPVNLYGIEDNFDPESSHVIPALIRKCVDAVEKRHSEIVIWGTGKATREFLFAGDAAEGIVLATERYNKAEPVNLGSGQETSIRDAVSLIASITGFKGRITWDSSKPDGQPRRCLDISKAESEFGFRAKVSLEEGLRKTIEWYMKVRPDRTG
jgi:GDP-L-fucose synthase